MRYAYVHSCGQPAFYYDHRPEYFARMNSKYATYPDGSKVTAMSELRCGSCGERLGQPSWKNIVAVPD